MTDVRDTSIKELIKEGCIQIGSGGFAGKKYSD